MRTQSLLTGALVLASASAPSATPTQAFLAYNGAVLGAKSLEDIGPVLPKRDRDKIAIAPGEANQMFLELHQDVARMSVGTPRVLKETLSGDRAIWTSKPFATTRSLSRASGKSRVRRP